VNARGRLALLGLCLSILVLATGCASAASLPVGECFDPPTTIGEAPEDVDRKPCNEPHGAEVVHVARFETEGREYPAESDFIDFLSATCYPAFDAYTGLEFDTAAEYDMAAFWPSEERWAGGDRTVICYAVRTDAAKMNASIRKP
jgi:hypothetical protein